MQLVEPGNNIHHAQRGLRDMPQSQDSSREGLVASKEIVAIKKQPQYCPADEGTQDRRPAKIPIQHFMTIQTSGTGILRPHANSMPSASGIFTAILIGLAYRPGN